MHAQLAQLFQYQALYEGFQVNLKMPNYLTCSETFETRQYPGMPVIAAQSVHMVLRSGVLEVSKSVAGAPGYVIIHATVASVYHIDGKLLDFPRCVKSAVEN